jgi:hypothetical protein
MLLTKPLPVDVTTTWWDYVIDVADILAGLGAAGAMLIAALAYRRQVNDARITQASLISLRWVRFDEPGHRGVIGRIEIVNDSTKSVEWLRVEVGLVG